jgi:glycosyltransferase involved in cell wall biosynthesis
MKKRKIYVNTLPWFISKHKTDWQSRLMMRELEDKYPQLNMIFPEAWMAGLGPNLDYAVSRLKARLPAWARRGEGGIPEKMTQLWEPDLRRFRPDVVLSQDQFPSNSRDIPVIWESQFVDPDHFLAETSPRDHEAWKRWHDVFPVLAEKAALVGLRGSYSMELARKTYPNLASKFRDLLFFLPHLEPVPADEVMRKHEGVSCLEVLFVGRQARLKGLPRVLEAVEQVRKKVPIRLHVVSRFDDGEIPLPQGDWLELHGETAWSDIRKLFLKCQVQIMPSLKESYGWVYLEGLAAGCVVMARDREPQREIVDYGRAGVLIDPLSSADMALKLERLAEDGAWRTRLALAGHRRFQEKYHWSVVGRSWCEAFEQAGGAD